MMLPYLTIPSESQGSEMKGLGRRSRQGLERTHRASAIGSLGCCGVLGGEHIDLAAQNAESNLDVGNDSMLSVYLVEHLV